MKAALVLAT